MFNIRLNTPADISYVTGIFLMLSKWMQVPRNYILHSVMSLSRFEITGYKKGLIEGIILGITVFAILYIPTTLVMLQPQLHTLISQNNPSLSQTQTQILGENILVTGLGFLAHIVYGVVLGSMTTFLLRRRGSS